MNAKMLPIGVDDFKKIRTENFYYIDKTSLIKDLLLNRGEVNLFTRPRRFGKSLNMSMLRHFFEISVRTKNCLMGWQSPGRQSCARPIWGSFP